ncbi:MAG TPA: zinc ribbon domain-containing protein, partial [Vicinamibacteria bacterium]
VALMMAGAALLLVQADRRRFEENLTAERDQVVERSRKYLAELAKRIDRLPVDPTLVAEVESRYFEEQASGPMQVWAMGTGGEFLFGVPRESFSRLNAVYDREITPRLKDGVFLDRQAFLLGQLDGGEDLGDLVLAGDSEEGRGDVADVVERLRRYAGRSDGAVILSAPLRSADGGALGSLYLKRARAEREWFRPDDRMEVVAGMAGGLAFLAFAFLWVLLPTWVYVDGTERGVKRARLFAFLTVLSSLVGLVVYLIARPEDARTLACPGCAREVNGGAFCPHCGRDLSAAFCPTCRYPLKPDWAFCPSCRTEIRPGAPIAAHVPDAPPAV